jgi:hypothetical protein
MNKKIEQLVLNAHGLCLDRMRYNSDLTIENFFNDDFLHVALPALHNTLDDLDKFEYDLENLLSDLSMLLKPKRPTQAFAEDKLETWLDSSRRSHPESRFNAYKKMLIGEGKDKASIIAQLDADTYKILDSCHNPNELNYEWDRRGLVYGHVQSGKTANYIGLVNRAFDAGYKIVIIFTGTTEDLRSQTQRRVDEGVIGYRDGREIGIALNNPEFIKLDEINPATSLKKDLKKNDDWRDSNLNTRKKSIWVIKKNKSVLENLILWLDKQRVEDGKIINVPFLVIDDEADNASIQSFSKKDFEDWGVGQSLVDIDSDFLTSDQEEALKAARERVIKAINRNIRVALSLMAHKSFVAYTATPYSIINQSEKDLERTVEIRGKSYIIDSDTDLFPEHFIIPITAGERYMGIERIFNSDRLRNLPVVVNLTNKYSSENLEKSYFPSKLGERYSFASIPKSLEDAILHFIVSIIIRKFRGHNDYNSLLVHTSHLTENADYLAFKIDHFISQLHESLFGSENKYLSRIEAIFREIIVNSQNHLFKTYFDCGYDFPQSITRTDLLDVLSSRMTQDHEYIYPPFEVVSYHSSKSLDLMHKNMNLDYNLRDINGKKRFKNYIVVGGNRLSRGLTLEGLTTSYFVRNSTRQDSLYQMARWFGYRVGYEDLVRIFMPVDQIMWFESVYRLEMDLRRDFIENNEADEDVKLLPRDAVIKMAYYTHQDMHLPERIIKNFPSICDPNKLRNTRRKSISFVGTFKTNRIDNKKEIQEKNIEVVRKTFDLVRKDPEAQLFEVSKSAHPEIHKNTNCNYINVNYNHICYLLTNYLAHDRIKDDQVALIDFIKKNNLELERWSLVLVNRGKEKVSSVRGDYYKNGELIRNELIGKVRRDDSAVLEPNASYANSIYFKSIVDQHKDNIFDIINQFNLKEFVDEINNKSQLAKTYRNMQKKPLMLIYLASTEKSDIDVFPLIYCFIPVIDNIKKVTYIIRNN